MSTKIFNFNQFNIETLKFNNPVKDRGNSFIAKLNSEDRFFFQTPKLKSLSKIILNHKGCHLLLDISNNKQFINFINKIDDFAKQYTFNNSKKWFHDDVDISNIDYDTINDFFYQTIQISKINNINISSLNLRISQHCKKPNINVYDYNKNVVDWNRLENNNELVAIIELKGLKFLNDKFICDWEIIQLKVDIKKSEHNLTKILINNSIKDSHTNIKSEDTDISSDYNNEINIVDNNELDDKPMTDDKPITDDKPMVDDKESNHSVELNPSRTVVNTNSDINLLENNMESLPVNKNDNYNCEIINGDVLDDLAKSDIHSIHDIELSQDELIKLIRESEMASEKANTLKKRAEKAKKKMAIFDNN